MFEAVIAKKKHIIDYIQSLGISLHKNFNEHLLLLVFIHKSYAADYKDVFTHNERLEFVGDGILGAVINKILFLEHPTMPESELTLYKIALVREEILAEVAKEIKLNTMVFISKGEEKMQGRQKASILSDTLEALLGYLYIDLGIEVVEQFIRKYIYSKIQKISNKPIQSYKTMVQEIIQKQHKILPEYRDSEYHVDQKGNVIQYKSEIYIFGKKVSEGIGTNKKKAQEEAAKKYYSLHNTIDKSLEK